MVYVYYNVDVEKLIQSADRLIRAIDESDKTEGVGDRTSLENEALEALRDAIKGYTGASFE